MSYRAQDNDIGGWISDLERRLRLLERMATRSPDPNWILEEIGGQLYFTYTPTGASGPVLGVQSGTVAEVEIPTSLPPSGTAGGVLSGTYPDPGFAVDMATQAELDAHISDPTDAHDASAISYLGGPGIVATDVEGALDELATEKADVVSAVMDGDAAGGVLSGTYPNPGFAVDMATQAELDAHVAAADPHPGYILESTANAKGDMFMATANDVWGVRTAPSNGRMFRADSAEADGWDDIWPIGPRSPAATGFVIAPRLIWGYSAVSPSSTAANSQNLALFSLFELYETTTFSAMSVNCVVGNGGAGTGIIRLGLLNVDDDNKPSSLIAETNTQPSINANGVKTASFAANQTLLPGVYACEMVCQSLDTTATNPTFSAANNGFIPGLPAGGAIPTGNAVFGRFQQSGVAGALGAATPTWATASSLATASLILFWLTVV